MELKHVSSCEVWRSWLKWEPFWKLFYRYNSAGNESISAQFSVQPQVTLPRTVTWQSATLFCKFNMADGRHNENRFFAYIWTIYCLINAKFRTKEHNYTQTQITWPKYSGSRHLNRDNKTANVNVKKRCSLSTTYSGEMTHRKQRK